MAEDMDVLDKVEAFLKKREGIDKVLKIMRYSAKLACWYQPQPRLEAFESSVGMSRKAFRVGKFLGNVNTLKRLSATTRVRLALVLMSEGGEAAYYFLEQAVWLSKTGLLDKGLAARMARPSALLELAKYIGSLSLAVLAMRELAAREAKLREAITMAEGGARECEAVSKTSAPPAPDSSPTPRAAINLWREREATTSPQGEAEAAGRAVARVSGGGGRAREGGGGKGEGGGSKGELEEKLAALVEARQLKMLGAVQDLADALLAINELRGGRGCLGHPGLLAACGLLSACISARKNWVAIK